MAEHAPDPPLLGRDRECDALDEVLAGVRAGDSHALAIRGEAGIGKSALLEHLGRRAAGCTVVRATGVESEMELAYAGLHQLCGPLLDRLPRLPGPQARAVEAAFGLRDDAAPDRFLVGLAVLTLLSEAAADRPLICIVDDAQWLDRASAQALAFVARRLGAESVALAVTIRDPSEDDEFSGLPALELHGLREGDARALLESVVAGPLDDRVRDRIVAETGGNPLALLELPRGLSPDEIAGGFGVSGAPAMASRIEQSFQRRVAALPETTRMLVLIAAAEPIGDPVLVLRAADRLGIAAAAAVAAEASSLVQLGGRVRFRHSLVRSAVYHGASESERRRVHHALAEVTDPQLDPDRRAWHRSAAVEGLDQDVADELERSAGRAQSRGGLAALAAFQERAAELSREPKQRAGRALVAAESKHHAGAPEAALRLLAMAQVGPLDELGQARAERLRAQIAFATMRGSDAPVLLLGAARTLERLDVRLSRDTYLDAWSAAMLAGRLNDAGGLLDVAGAVRTAPEMANPRPSDLLLDGFALACTDGRVAATPALKRAIAAFAGSEVSTEEVVRWSWLATAAAVWLWDYEAGLDIAARGVQLARELGALELLAVAINVLVQGVVFSGDFAQAALLIAEANAITEATGTRVAPYGALVLAALTGREVEADRLVSAAVEDATAGGQGSAVHYASWAQAVLYNGLARYEEALAAAIKASEMTPVFAVAARTSSELIEAATRTGNGELAARVLTRLEEQTDATDADWALGIAARSRALVSGGAVAEELYREAIDRFGCTRLRLEVARAHLLYGEWLRREGRRVDARAQLRTAYGMLIEMGADPFAERARRELLATGETVRRRVPETLDELTPQEIEIARLASNGLTNPEIGAHLFLSPRTIEWHLRKVYGKLGIGSRKALRGALAAAAR